MIERSQVSHQISDLLDVSEPFQLFENLLVGVGHVYFCEFLFQHVLDEFLRRRVAGSLGTPDDAVPEGLSELECRSRHRLNLK